MIASSQNRDANGTSQQRFLACEMLRQNLLGFRRERYTNRPVCLNISIIFVWNTGSTASTLTPVPLCGIANTSTTRTVKSSTNSPNIKPMTSMGTPALPCRNILSSANEEIYTVSELSIKPGLSYELFEVSFIIFLEIIELGVLALGNSIAYTSTWTSPSHGSATGQQLIQSIHCYLIDLWVSKRRVSRENWMMRLKAKSVKILNGVV